MGEASRAFCYSHSSAWWPPCAYYLRSIIISVVGKPFSSRRFASVPRLLKQKLLTPIRWHLMYLLQVPEGVPSGPVPSVLAAQVSAAPSLFSLAGIRTSSTWSLRGRLSASRRKRAAHERLGRRILVLMRRVQIAQQWSIGAVAFSFREGICAFVIVCRCAFISFECSKFAAGGSSVM